jgi:hypothetical protein
MKCNFKKFFWKKKKKKSPFRRHSAFRRILGQVTHSLRDKQCDLVGSLVAAPVGVRNSVVASTKSAPAVLQMCKGQIRNGTTPIANHVEQTTRPACLIQGITETKRTIISVPQGLFW